MGAVGAPVCGLGGTAYASNALATGSRVGEGRDQIESRRSGYSVDRRAVAPPSMTIA